MSNESEPETKIIHGDSDDVLAEFEDDSFHAVVCDPPYGLNFMPETTNGWDQFEPKEYQEWCEEWARECLRVLKPGGHLIAFSGNRTHHRLFAGVEDAGFEIRDSLTWLYGTGFPKAADVSKHIDRYYDAEDEREVVETYAERSNDNDSMWGCANPENEQHDGSTLGTGKRVKTKPATSEAERWDGWRTALKPAVEFAVLARAPMSEDAIYKNVMGHGTGALNIDRTRIPAGEGGRPNRHSENRPDETDGMWHRNNGTSSIGCGSRSDGTTTQGRYPANLLLDPIASQLLDEQSGECQTGNTVTSSDSNGAVGFSTGRDSVYVDAGGGASRYFKTVEPTRFKYTSKASKRERTIDGQLDNEHPTVKPLTIMSWLVTLVTAPGQKVLDPFAGSGTTIMACKRLGREGVGIEMDEEHAELARKRVELAHELETDFDTVEHSSSSGTDDQSDGPTTLESFGDD